MNPRTSEYRSILLAEHPAPCLSLYEPTHRRQPDRRQDPIRYKNLVKALDESLRRDYAAAEAESLLAPFRALEDDHSFWNHGQEGLAIFASPDLFRVYRLQRSVPERAIVAQSFHTKPLLRILQSSDRYHVLALNRREACLYEGNRDAIAPIDIVPGSARMVTGEPVAEQRADDDVVGSTLGAPTTREGTDATQDVIDHDTDVFFRAVDQAVLLNHTRPTGLPLLLASLPQYHGRFRAVSANTSLVDGALDVYAPDVPLDTLRERAWEVMRPRYRARLAALSDTYRAARARDLSTDDVARAAKAAVEARVETLLIEAERMMPGHIDSRTGAVTIADLEHPDVDDILDDLGEQVMRTGGEVVVVPKDDMPSSTGVAATFRY
jgi:release factor family 3